MPFFDFFYKFSEGSKSGYGGTVRVIFCAKILCIIINIFCYSFSKSEKTDTTIVMKSLVVAFANVVLTNNHLN